jgi:hypothetical protein
MNIAFYDASVASYLQILGGMDKVLDKAEAAANEGVLDLEAVVGYRLRDDMAPFSFQVISAWHHSRGAIEGVKAGLFEPPPKMDDRDWSALRKLVSEAREYLAEQDRDEINKLTDKAVIFRLGEREIPFTADNFLLSFSLPNFYFHATTTYSVLRIHGVPLGKTDFLGQLRIDR